MKYIGIDIGATNLKAGLVDETGQILAKQKMKVAQIESPDLLARHLARMTEELAGEAGVSVDEIFSIGVGVPGVVEIRSGSLQYSCNLPFRRVPLRRLFHKYMNKPLYLENDGNCAAVGEYYAGAGRSSKRFVTITLGTGIGGGIIHMSIEYNGQPCPCGRKGCWERYASATALKRLTKRVLEENPESILRQVVDENEGHVSGQSAFIAARRGDPIGQYVCDAYIDYLCAGIINLVNIFQPDTLAIGGGVSNEQDEQLLFPVRRIVAEQSIPCEPERRTRIVKAELGSAAGMIGAALLGKKKRI